jgi:hypothetical protein
MTPAKLRLAQAAMAKRDTKVGDLCKELGVTRQTLYRFVDPKGEMRADGTKLLSARASMSAHEGARDQKMYLIRSPSWSQSATITRGQPRVATVGVAEAPRHEIARGGLRRPPRAPNGAL